MAHEIHLPALGENVESGEVVAVKVAKGDVVKEGQTLIEVESEKATVEVPSPSAGTITEVRVKNGDQVSTGQTLCLIEATDERKAEQKPEAKQQPAAKPAKKDAERTEEASREESKRGAPAEKEKPIAVKPQAPTDGREEKLAPAGPATRRLARELGVTLSLVTGSARHGRVTQDDVKAFVREMAAGRTGAGPALQAPALPNFEQWGAIDKKPFESIRRKIAEQMSRSWNVIPHVTHQDLADITELEAFRKQQGSDGPKVTVTPFAIKAASIMLRQMPIFNASLDLASAQIVYKQYYHIGVAVDTEHGLLVPVLRDADKKSVHELAQELAEAAEQARNRKLSAEQMRGGTFTITNLGGIGGVAFSPIINYPQVAILGLSRARMQPVWKDSQFVPRLLLPLSLSYDHRLIDGADAARFTRRFAELLENPLVMLLHA